MNRNEKRRWSRILAMILVFAMVFCDPSMSYAAEVVGEMLTARSSCDRKRDGRRSGSG